jgi:NDP-sugar pyrophosphorylase family protein
MAAILAGGLGTRLRPLVSDRPKPMALVNGKPFLEYLLYFLKKQNVTNILFCLHYMKDHFIKHFGNGTKFGMSINYSIEPKPLGTAGALKHAEKSLEDRFYVFNGDTLLEVNLAKLLDYQLKRNALATIALTQVSNPNRYGLVNTTENGRICSFLEKKCASKAFVNAGVYVFEKSILSYIPKELKVSLEREIFPTLLKAGEPLYGYPTSGFFIDIGTPRDYIGFQKKVRSQRN